MKGSYKVVVENAKLKYEFIIERNISILKDYSGTGKSNLIRMIDASNRGAAKLQCDKKCYSFSSMGIFWKEELLRYSNAILFFDEGCSFVASKEFAEVVKESDCYFVIITRRSLKDLPYSIQTVYRIHESSKYGILKKENVFYNRYINSNISISKDDVDLVLVEDSNSGYDFFSKIFHDRCIHADGNSSIKGKLNTLINSNYRHILVIVDGAAFGAFVEEVTLVCAKLQRKGICVDILARESFEFVLLMSDFLYNKYKYRLVDYKNNIESSQFLSWERYFTWLLQDITKGTVAEYTKKQINPYYLSDKCIRSVMQELGIQETTEMNYF